MRLNTDAAAISTSALPARSFGFKSVEVKRECIWVRPRSIAVEREDAGELTKSCDAVCAAVEHRVGGIFELAHFLRPEVPLEADPHPAGFALTPLVIRARPLSPGEFPCKGRLSDPAETDGRRRRERVEVVVPDNLKSGVSKACRYDPETNPAYQQLAQHHVPRWVRINSQRQR